MPGNHKTRTRLQTPYKDWYLFKCN